MEKKQSWQCQCHLDQEAQNDLKRILSCMFLFGCGITLMLGVVLGFKLYESPDEESDTKSRYIAELITLIFLYTCICSCLSWAASRAVLDSDCDLTYCWKGRGTSSHFKRLGDAEQPPPLDSDSVEEGDIPIKHFKF